MKLYTYNHIQYVVIYIYHLYKYIFIFKYIRLYICIDIYMVHERNNGAGKSFCFMSLEPRLVLGDGCGFLLRYRMYMYIFDPRDPITLSDDDWGVQSPPQQGI